MNGVVIVTLISHFAFAIVLFFGVNWIGKHAVDFGYTSMTLFEEPNESVALNFFLRAMAPAVFIIAISAIAVAIGRPEWRVDTYWVAVYYYLLRGIVIFLLNRQRLISWPKFAFHAAIGIIAAVIAYRYLILPNRSLLPNMEQAGNELWLAILAFLYAVSNKVPVTGGPGARRRNNFVSAHYSQARARYGNIIDARASDEALKLIIYGVLIYEDYARPVAIREVERWMFWKQSKTTGIMQVTANKPLSDTESVVLGSDILAQAWAKHAVEQSLCDRVWNTIANYNADSDYIRRVQEVIEILAMRVEPKFRPTYSEIWE